MLSILTAKKQTADFFASNKVYFWKKKKQQKLYIFCVIHIALTYKSIHHIVLSHEDKYVCSSIDSMLRGN